MNAAIEYLRAKEWSMGNGQCPECHAVPESWLGHPLHLDSSSIGHKRECALAAALQALGEAPTMLGQFKSPQKFELFWKPYTFPDGQEISILTTRLVK